MSKDKNLARSEEEIRATTKAIISFWIMQFLAVMYASCGFLAICSWMGYCDIGADKKELVLLFPIILLTFGLWVYCAIALWRYVER